jgi:hypothetical protein
MACPIHIWVPLVAAAAPAARVARHRVSAWRAVRRDSAPATEPPRELKRWAPVGAAANDRGPDTTSS